MIKFESKFLVVNRKYLHDIPGWKSGLVAWALRTIDDHVPENEYYVCNRDEPYADKVITTGCSRREKQCGLHVEMGTMTEKEGWIEEIK